ncbi:MAG: penicillin-binding transpeptidase domain-containing protein [Pseudomonadota bacterium]
MYPEREKRINWIGFRIALVGSLFALGTLVLIMRAYQLQVTEAEQLQARANKARTRVLQLEGRRGALLDRSGEQIAASLEVTSIFARPHRVEDKKSAAKVLAESLEMESDEVLKKLEENKPFVWIQRRVSPLMADKVSKADLKGVFSVKEHKRFYPLKSLAAHVIGFAGMDSAGLEGLELYYDRDLKADPVPITAQRDALGRPVMFTGPARAPNRLDVHLTIDRNIQYIAEKELEEVVRREKAVGGTAVVMDADSGDVVALAVQPTYNLNLFHTAPATIRRNRAIADTFEPGSTFKVFLAATALELDLVTDMEKIVCHNGLYKYNGAEIHDVTPHDRLSFEEVFVHSSNIGAVKISEKLKKGEFFRLLQGFGFGALTEVDFPGERSGVLSPPARWSNLTKANLAFGQGITVSGLQITTAFAAAVNGGFLYKPQFMRKVTNALGETVRENRPTLVRRVIKPGTSERLIKILRRVVLEGTGKAAGIHGVDIIGKTGTAQKAEPSGGYSRDKYVASFIGAILDLRPRLVIFVMIDEPAAKHRMGGKIAAPVFKNMAERILALYGRNPGKPETLLASSQADARGRGAARNRPAALKKGSREGEWIVPDLKGLDMRQVLDLCTKMKCDAAFKGSGYAVQQDPQPGAVLQEGSPLAVSFEG